MNLAPPIESKLGELSRLYLSALHHYLKGGPTADLETARELGHHAMTIGMETLDLARVHEIALISLVLPKYPASSNDGMLARAETFFAEALTSIEQAHGGTLRTNEDLTQLVKILSQRTLELADSVEELKREMIQRKMAEESFRSTEHATSVLLAESHRMQVELSHLSHQLLSVQDEERRRISRELRDGISRTLTDINGRLAEMKTGTIDGKNNLLKKICGTQSLVEQSVELVQRFSRDLRPTLLDDLGLIPALQAFMKDYMEETGIRVSLRSFSGIEQSNSDRRTILYRIAQEALANVACHAHASRVEVSIQKLQGSIRMEVIDDGQGFALEEAPDAETHHRLGLLRMKERIGMVGGTLQVESSPGNPTTVRIEIPGE